MQPMSEAQIGRASYYNQNRNYLVSYMYSFIYWFYFKAGYASRKRAGRPVRFLFRCSSWLCLHYCNDFLVKTFRRGASKRSGVTGRKREQRIIASLTSYPARIHTAWIAIETILRQRMKADEVVLWLAASQFPQGLAELPPELLAQRSRGLTIRFCEDLCSHKKYYFTLREYPEAIMVLFDDDMFYPKNIIKKLMKIHRRFPDNIVCSSSSRIEPQNCLEPIIWEPNLEEAYNVQYLGVNSGSGTLIPPKALHENVLDMDMLKTLAFMTDDLWLTAAAYMRGTKLSSLKYRPFPVPARGTQKESLYYSNNFETSAINNNTQWQAILNHYAKELACWQEQFGIGGHVKHDRGEQGLEEHGPGGGTKLSIVIPVYNLEAYIAGCMDSVLRDGNKAAEILLIDDGSTDNSPGICDRYAKEHPNVRVIHKSNGGASEARNTGIRNASGDYIMFIDGDDLLEEGAVDVIIRELDGVTELYTFNYYDYYEENKEKKAVKHLEQAGLYDRDGSITGDLFYTVPALPMPWLYVIKREFLQKHRLYMKTGLLDEDEEWSARLFARVSKVRVLDIYAYLYRRNRADSLSHIRREANLMADLDIINLLTEEAGKDCYDKRQKHILHNKCRELMMKILREKSARPDETQEIINVRLGNSRRLLLGGGLTEKSLCLLSRLLGWDKAYELLEKAIRLKSGK